MILDSAPPLELVRELFLEYSRLPGVNLCVENFEQELAELTSRYCLLLLAKDGNFAAGCAALRSLEAGIAELKRLYVREQFRGSGLGRRLTAAAIEEAKHLGFSSLRLDTLPSMTSAIALYRSLGFREIAPYHSSPMHGLLFFELAL